MFLIDFISYLFLFTNEKTADLQKSEFVTWDICHSFCSAFTQVQVLTQAQWDDALLIAKEELAVPEI